MKPRVSRSGNGKGTSVLNPSEPKPNLEPIAVVSVSLKYREARSVACLCMFVTLARLKEGNSHFASTCPYMESSNSTGGRLFDMPNMGVVNQTITRSSIMNGAW